MSDRPRGLWGHGTLLGLLELGTGRIVTRPGKPRMALAARPGSERDRALLLALAPAWPRVTVGPHAAPLPFGAGLGVALGRRAAPPPTVSGARRDGRPSGR